MFALRSSLLALLIVAAGARAATAGLPLVSVYVVPDITVDLDGSILSPSGVYLDELSGAFGVVNLGALPPDVHIDAYQRNGVDDYFSFDTTAALPGGVVAGPADVVRRDTNGYAIVFDGAANGIPAGVNLDAFSFITPSSFALSFDTSVSLDGAVYEDEDLVRFSEGGGFSSYFDGSEANIPPELDVDGAQVLPGDILLLSFDGSGNVAGLVFDDEDILKYDRTADDWGFVYGGSRQYAGWAPGDLVAFYALVESPTPEATPTAPVATMTPTAPATPTGPVATTTATAPATPTATGPTPTGTPPTATPTSSTPVACGGDCDGSGDVNISELITLVNIALGSTPVSACEPGDIDQDGNVTINELIVAVNNALNGCP